MMESCLTLLHVPKMSYPPDLQILLSIILLSPRTTNLMFFLFIGIGYLFKSFIMINKIIFLYKFMDKLKQFELQFNNIQIKNQRIQTFNFHKQKMLIKDPYLSSDIKNRSYSAFQQAQSVPQFNTFSQKQPQPSYNQYSSEEINKKRQISLLPNQIQSYQREMRSLSDAYRNQEQILNKVNKYQAVNQQYHEAMKQRNYQLNTKLNDLTYEKTLLAKRHQEEAMRISFDKDLILKRYQEQNQEILRLKKTVSQLIEHKARLQSEIDHLIFTIQKDNHQGSLEIKEQLIRMQNMQRTLRNMVDTKDQQILQLRHRLKVYEDENRRLNDLNRTLTITRQDNKIDNLSKIQNLDSNAKPNFNQNKQNIDLNKKDDNFNQQLKQQKQINQHLMDEINMLKKKLFDEPPKIIKNKKTTRIKSEEELIEVNQQVQIKNFVKILEEERERVANKFYEIYCQANKQGEKYKKNSLLIFIEKWKKINKKQSEKGINQYSKVRESLKNSLKQLTSENLINKIQEVMPSKIKSKVYSKQGQATLSIMQHTKNMKNNALKQKYSEQSNTNNNILYLFRLLTILYRLKNPVGGGSAENLENQVYNQLLHSIVKAVQNIYENN